MSTTAPVEHDWAANPRIQWYRSPLPMAELRALSQRRTLRPLLHCLGFIALLTATGTAVVLTHRHLSWPWLIPALFLHGTVFRTLQHSRHELSHRTVFRSKLVNELFLRLFSFLHWSSPDHFRASHVRHHQYTVHDDLDQEVRLPRRCSRCSGPAASCWRYPHDRGDQGAGPVEPGPAGRQSVGAALFRRPPPRPGRRRQARGAVRLGAGRAGRALGAGGVFIATGQWMLLLVVTFARWLAPWLSFMFIETQHSGLCSDVPDFRRCCRTVLLGPVTRFLYWHMNYHVEHHMYPSVPFYNLGKLRRAIAADLPPATRGLWRSWAQMLPILCASAATPATCSRLRCDRIELTSGHNGIRVPQRPAHACLRQAHRMVQFPKRKGTQDAEDSRIARIPRLRVLPRDGLGDRKPHRRQNDCGKTTILEAMYLLASEGAPPPSTTLLSVATNCTTELSRFPYRVRCAMKFAYPPFSMGTRVGLEHSSCCLRK